jgi:large subunit ribosomal protein L27
MIRSFVGNTIEYPTAIIKNMGYTCGGYHLGIQRREATKKAGGTVKNTSGSPGQRLGLKKWGEQPVIPGNIIVRQRGRHYWEGENVGIGKDFTLFSLVTGRVRFEQVRRPNGKRKTIVHVDAKELSPDCITYAWVG